LFKLLATGLGRFELVSLTWHQVDLIDETVELMEKEKKKGYSLNPASGIL